MLTKTYNYSNYIYKKSEKPFSKFVLYSFLDKKNLKMDTCTDIANYTNTIINNSSCEELLLNLLQKLTNIEELIFFMIVSFLFLIMTLPIIFYRH